MKRVLMMVSLLAAPGLLAQNPQPAQPAQPAQPGVPAPEGPRMQGPGGERSQMLRMQIEERFGRMVQAELQLNEQQMTRLREVMRGSQDRRRDLGRREADLHRAIRQQLQPGVQANNDSLNRLIQGQVALRTQRAQSDEQFVRELTFLTPVQRARFLMMVGNFERRVEEVRGRMAPRMDEQGPGRARMPPRERMGRPLR